MVWQEEGVLEERVEVCGGQTGTEQVLEGGSPLESNLWLTQVDRCRGKGVDGGDTICWSNIVASQEEAAGVATAGGSTTLFTDTASSTS